jgi:hypothetical protein
MSESNVTPSGALAFPSPGRLLLSTLLNWLAVLGFDLFQHAGLFPRLWVDSRSAFLPPGQLFKLLPLGYLAFLVSSALLMWLLVRLRISGWKRGAIFPLQIGAFLYGALVLGWASVFPVKPALLVAIFFGGVAQDSIAGAVLGSGLARHILGGLALNVSLFVIPMVALTVLLGPLGLAPPLESRPMR